MRVANLVGHARHIQLPDRRHDARGTQPVRRDLVESRCAGHDVSGSSTSKKPSTVRSTARSTSSSISMSVSDIDRSYPRRSQPPPPPDRSGRRRSSRRRWRGRPRRRCRRCRRSRSRRSRPCSLRRCAAGCRDGRRCGAPGVGARAHRPRSGAPRRRRVHAPASQPLDRRRRGHPTVRRDAPSPRRATRP